MKISENISDEVKEIAPLLSTIKKDNYFNTPDQYFDELASTIQQKIQKDKNQSFDLLKYLHKPQFALAASFFVLICISAFYFFQYNHNNNHLIAQNTSIYWDDILNENNAIVDKLDEALLVETLATEVILNNNQPINTINQPNQNTLDEVSDYIDSKYNNDIFNEL